jgi:ATP-dependent Clp protease ATP-binding subunit ClpA
LFNRFSSAARRALRLAEQECRNRNHYYVGAEHLLLGVCTEPDAPTLAYLAERGIAPDAVCVAVRRALGTGDDRSWEGIILTPRLKAIVELAEQGVGPDATIEPVDLLQGIVAEGRSGAAELLRVAAGNLSASRQVAR